MKLSEGLRPGDLEHMVLPLISIDEFDTICINTSRR